MKGEVFGLRLKRLITKDMRSRKEMLYYSAEKVVPSFSPIVGYDKNGRSEPKIEKAVQVIEPYDKKVKEVEHYA